MANKIPNSAPELWAALMREARALVIAHALVQRGTEDASVPALAYAIADGMEEESGLVLPEEPK
jgi:hypothetical protein